LSAQKHDKPVGLTKDVGYQIGIRRTINSTVDEVWSFLTSPEGISIWLGSGTISVLDVKIKYQLDDGSNGEIRVYKPNSHLRLTWNPQDWTKPSTIQLRVIPNKTRTTIAFHQENLPNSEQREKRRAFYKSAIDQIEKALS
jgi:uncharacterized protein YndB with AHSA1/START domain